MEQQKKRTKIAQLKYEHKVAESSRGDAAMKVVSRHKQLNSRAKKRASSSISDVQVDGPAFTPVNKHTAMTSGISGEMPGVEECFRCIAPCIPTFIFH